MCTILRSFNQRKNYIYFKYFLCVYIHFENNFKRLKSNYLIQKVFNYVTLPEPVITFNFTWLAKMYINTKNIFLFLVFLFLSVVLKLVYGFRRRSVLYFPFLFNEEVLHKSWFSVGLCLAVMFCYSFNSSVIYRISYQLSGIFYWFLEFIGFWIDIEKLIE